MSAVGLGSKNDFWREPVADPPSRHRGRPTLNNPQLLVSNKNPVLGPRWSLTPRQTGRQIVGRSITCNRECDDVWSLGLGERQSPADNEVDVAGIRYQATTSEDEVRRISVCYSEL
jgi:hypothetical protein